MILTEKETTAIEDLKTQEQALSLIHISEPTRH